MKLNADWHRKHPMPGNATEAQRLRWHVQHQKHCACRPMPARLAALLEQKAARRGRR